MSALDTNLFELARNGNRRALAELFNEHRARLRRMICLRLDHRLAGRVDPSDVLQDAYLEVNKRFDEYARDPTVPVFIWLRLVTGQKLTDLHRFHLGVQKRAASRELSLYSGALPQPTSVSLAAQLVGRTTTASQAAMRAELRLRVQEALESMDPLDREVLALRHFEQLSNGETAQVLDISKNAASNRYIRAIKRLKGILSDLPDFSTG